MRDNTQIKWKQYPRSRGEYHLARLNSKNLSWCIRRQHDEDGYWLGMLVSMTDITLRTPGVHRGDFGPFVLLDAAKAALEVMYQPKEK